MKSVNGDKELRHSAEALSVVSICVSEEDGPAGLRHVCLGPRVPPLRLQLLQCCWFIHISASQCLCEDLCIGVRCEIHRCVWYGVAQRQDVPTQHGYPSFWRRTHTSSSAGLSAVPHTNDASVSSRLKQRWAMESSYV